MSLLKELNQTPLFRTLSLPENIRNICLIVLSDDLNKISAILEQYPNLHIASLIIPDLTPEKTKKIHLEINKQKTLVVDLENIHCYPEYEKVLLCPDDPVESAMYITLLARFARKCGIDFFYLASSCIPPHTIRPPLPDFFHTASSELARAFKLFEDDFSKKTFIGRIKAILTGNAGYIPIAAHEEYFHPHISPAPGDIVIDGGVSDMVQNQIKMLAAIKDSGHIFGFEPIPHMARKAAESLAAYPNYHLETTGLSDKPGKMLFEDLKDSSHMAEENSPDNVRTIECQLTSIDSFCDQNNISHIDCIKLDVEGAELKALQGAENMIKSCHPKLIICLYHKPEDLYEIPVYLKKLNPEYKLYLAHSSCQFMDTILYAAT